MYRIPGTSSTPSASKPPETHSNLPAPYLNFEGFPTNTTLTLDTIPDSERAPPTLPARSSLSPESRLTLPPRLQARARQSLVSLSSFAVGKRTSHAYSQSQPQSQSQFYAYPHSQSSSSDTSSTPRSPTKPNLPTPDLRRSSQQAESENALHCLNFTPAPSPASDLLTLSRHIETQTAQARHLFTQKSPFLDTAERRWINSTISDTEVATREVAILTESLRVDQATNHGRLGMKSQLKWFVRDAKRAREKQERLVVLHASLMTVLSRLQGIQTGVAETDEVRDISTEVGDREADIELVANGPGADADEKGDRLKRNWKSEPAAPILSESGSKTTTRHVGQDALWDLSVQLQDAGMEAVMPNMIAEKVSPSVRTEPVNEASSPSATMDNELMDMLSWRWAQGRANT
ncbi:hypothetical protein BJX64DRAFT_266801 [Aspergillus heterothallicus]